MDLTNFVKYMYRHCLTQSFFFWVHDNGIFNFGSVMRTTESLEKEHSDR